MTVYAIAILEFDDLAADSLGGDDPQLLAPGRPYRVSDTASLIPVFLDYCYSLGAGAWEGPWAAQGQGPAPRIAEPVVINGRSYGGPMDRLVLSAGLFTTAGDVYFPVRIGGHLVGLTGPKLPKPGATFTMSPMAWRLSEPHPVEPALAAAQTGAVPAGIAAQLRI